jgi:hypothetical protein
VTSWNASIWSVSADSEAELAVAAWPDLLTAGRHDDVPRAETGRNGGDGSPEAYESSVNLVPVSPGLSPEPWDDSVVKPPTLLSIACAVLLAGCSKSSSDKTETGSAAPPAGSPKPPAAEPTETATTVAPTRSAKGALEVTGAITGTFAWGTREVSSKDLPAPLKSSLGFNVSGDDTILITAKFDTKLGADEKKPDLTLKGTLEVSCPKKK